MVKKDFQQIINNQKETASVVLKQLADLGYRAICAGGAPRNWDHGLVANDIDIYVSGPYMKIKDAYDILGDVAIILTTAEGYEGVPPIKYVLEGKIDSTRVQLIGCDSVKDIHLTFPVSISQVTFDGVSIVGSAAYNSGKELSVCLYYKDKDNRKDGRYLQKIQNYYPHYKFMSV